jgi:hypothetical protein
MPEKLTPRQLMDPEATLPKVNLAPDEDEQSGGVVTYYNLMHEGSKIGHASIEQVGDGEQAFDDIDVDEEYRNRRAGFGRAAYLAAIENAHAEGNIFRTHPLMFTEPASRVWENLIKNGVAEQLTPFEAHDDKRARANGRPRTIYRGHAQIKPPVSH